MNKVSFIVTTSSPFCYTSVMTQNVNPVKLINEKERIRIVIFRNFFLGISKVTDLLTIPSSSEFKVLKDYTTELLYQRPEKQQKIRIINLCTSASYAQQNKPFEYKVKKGSRKMPMPVSCFHSITL